MVELPGGQPAAAHQVCQRPGQRRRGNDAVKVRGVLADRQAVFATDTMKWKKAGRIVKGGQKGTPVVFFVNKNVNGEVKKVRKVKFVFNIEQTEPIQQPLSIAGVSA